MINRAAIAASPAAVQQRDIVERQVAAVGDEEDLAVVFSVEADHAAAVHV
jgi:hypothetical protein